MADADRPLTEEGIERFRAAAEGLARVMPPPDLLLTSPLRRARETALIASEAWGGPKPREAGCLADGTVEDFFGVLAKVGHDASVAIFGHEPHLSEVLAALVGSKRSDALEFKKGGAALVEIVRDPRGGGRVIWFLPPRILRRLR